MYTDIQEQIARETSDKLGVRFYDFNIGWCRALTATMNSFGFVLHIQRGRPEFKKEQSQVPTDIRTDNIYVPTPLAVTLAAYNALKKYPELKRRPTQPQNPFGRRGNFDQAFNDLFSQMRGKSWPRF